MRAGRVSARNRSSARQSGPFGPLGIVERGWAARVSVSPLAMPIRRSPKSIATMIVGCMGARSGMTGDRGELPGFDAEQPKRGEPTLLVGQIEYHAFICRHRQPGVVEHLLFELTGFPPGITERDEGLLGSGARSHGGNYIARSGHLDGVGDLVCGVPFTARPVQHEAAILVDGSPAQHRQVCGTL